MKTKTSQCNILKLLSLTAFCHAHLASADTASNFPPADIFAGPANLFVPVGGIGSVAKQVILPSAGNLNDVRVFVMASNSQSLNLAISQTPDGSNALMNLSGQVTAGQFGWQQFLVTNGPLLQAGSYYILLSSDSVGTSWAAMDGGTTNPQPGRVSYVSGSSTSNLDFLCEVSSSGGSFYITPAYLVDFECSNTIMPGASLHFTNSPGSSMLLTKDVRSATVNLQDAAIDVQISSTVTNGVSLFTVTNGSGHFAAYVFGGVPIGVSAFNIESGTGSINWASGALLGVFSVRTTLAGYPDIVATAFSSATINFTNNTVNLSSDGEAFQTTLPVPINVAVMDGKMVLNWNDPTFAFTLQAAATVNQVFTNVTGAISPYTNTITALQQFFRLQSN